MSKNHYDLRKNPRKSLKAREAELDKMSSSEQTNEEEEDMQNTISQTAITLDSNLNDCRDDAEDTISNTEEVSVDKQNNEGDTSEHSRDSSVDSRSRGTDMNISQLAQMIMDMKTDLKTDMKEMKTEIKTDMNNMENNINHKMERQIDKIRKDLTEKFMRENEIMREELSTLIETNQKLNCQKIDNLDQKVGNMEKRIQGQWNEKEDQIINKIEDKISKLNIQRQSERERDHTTFTTNLSDISNQVKSNQDQVNNKFKNQDAQINEQNQRLDKHQHRIHTMEDKLEEYKFDASQVHGKIPVNHITVSCAGEMYGHNVPKFNGKISNPQEYLEKMKRCYENNQKARYGGGEMENPECLHEVIGNSMERSASQWWQLNKPNVHSWQQFEQIFLDKYWNKEIQRHLRQKIELERYRPGGYLNRTDYFLERILILKAMTPPLNEEDIVNILASHYDEVIQTARRVQNSNTITAFEMLLQREDMLDVQKNLQLRNRIKPDIRKNPQNNSSAENQNHPFNGRENFRAYYPRNPPPAREGARPNEDRKTMFRNIEQNRDNEHFPRNHPREPYYERNQYHSNQYQNNKPMQNNNWNKDNQDRRSQNNYYKNKGRQYPSQEQMEVCNNIVMGPEVENKTVENAETRVYTNSHYKSRSPQRSNPSLNY